MPFENAATGRFKCLQEKTDALTTSALLPYEQRHRTTDAARIDRHPVRTETVIVPRPVSYGAHLQRFSFATGQRFVVANGRLRHDQFGSA